MHTCIFIKREDVCISIKRPCTQGCLGSLWNLNYMFLRDISNLAQYIYTINVQVDQKILDSLSLFFFLQINLRYGELHIDDAMTES